MASLLKLGTRGSKLALIQAGMVRDALARAVPALAAPDAIEIVVIKTTGDAIQDRALAEAGGKGLFVKEIEEALLSGRIDIAMHSMKDMPTAQPDGLLIAAFLAREDARDVLIAGDVRRIADLAPGAIVGTAALRRRAQLLHLRPDLKVVTLRGNVDTRLAKRERGEVEATLLALAGLKRMDLAHVGTPVPEDEMLPAVGQGAVCMPRRRCRRAGLAGRRRPRTDRDLRGRRTCDAGRARRIVPHADRRSRRVGGRRAASARPDRQAGRLRGPHRRASGHGERCGAAGQRARPRAQAPRRPRLPAGLMP